MMTWYLSINSLALACAVASATVAAATPKDQYAHATRAAAERYAEDRKICDDETDPAHRLQCLRAAKEENNKALASAKANLKADQSAANGGHGDKAVCLHCGKVLSVTSNEKSGNALGLIGGGVAGALLGNQVGGGGGRDLATVAGAVGGAYAGKKLQERANAATIWTVEVEYDNGHRRSFQFDRDPALKVGDRVHDAGQSIARG